MISVVVPVYNEQESLETLHTELDRAFSADEFEAVEFIFIDDGSKDGSWQVIRTLAERDTRVRAVRFRRNFGKAAALTAGFQAARGRIVFTMDADLQDDPVEIPKFLAKLDEGFDVVSGWKQKRHDPWHKVLPSRVFNATVSWLTGCRLHDHNCGFKVYRAEVLREVGIYGELHRFVPVFAHAKGFRVGELVVNHRARRFGYSKYGVARLIKGFLDLMTVRFLTRFGQSPLHILGTIGLLMILIGGIGMISLAVLWAIDASNRPIGNRPLLVYSAVLLGVGTQLVSVGILAELVTSYNLRAGDTYSIAETLRAAEEPLVDARAVPSPQPPPPVPPSNEDETSSPSCSK